MPARKKVVKTPKIRRIRKLPPEVLFKQNLGLAFGAANNIWRRYGSRLKALGITQEEIQQEALVLLHKCCVNYDPAKANLSTFVYTYTNFAAIRLLQDKQFLFEQRLLSLDAPLKRKSGREESLLAVIEDRRGRFKIPENLRELILSELDALNVPDRHKTIFKKRFGLTGEPPKLLEEVGKMFGVKKQRIWQIEKKILKKLRGKSSLRQLFEQMNA